MYWDNVEEYNKRGIDGDLYSCLEYNSQKVFGLDDINKVLAVHQGENDGDDWRWVLQLKKPVDGKRFVFLMGGCDYTGWDCQSWASHILTTTAKRAAMAVNDLQISENNSPQDAGLGHMISMLSGGYGNNFRQVEEELLQQLKTNKTKTWREQTQEDLGDVLKDLDNIK